MTGRRFLAIVLASTLFAARPAMSDDVPSGVFGIRLASADEVLALQDKGALIFDVRDEADYADGHIKGAINVPYRERSAATTHFSAKMDEFRLLKLPGERSVPIVFGGDGPESWRSYKASIAALRVGYTSIHWYRAGFPDWKARGLPVE